MPCVPEWTIFYYLNWSHILLNLIVLFHPQERTKVAKVGGWCPGSYALSECLPYKGGGSPGFQLVFTSNRILILWNNKCHSQASSFLLPIQYLPHSNLLLKTTYTDWNILIIKPTRCTNFSNLFLDFLCPSSGVFHCTHSKLVWHIPLLCVRWKTPDDGQRNCPKHVEFYSKNKFEKLMHLVGFIIRIYHDARSPERQWLNYVMLLISSASTAASSIFSRSLFIYLPVIHRCMVWAIHHWCTNFPEM